MLDTLDSSVIKIVKQARAMAYMFEEEIMKGKKIRIYNK